MLGGLFFSGTSNRVTAVVPLLAAITNNNHMYIPLTRLAAEWFYWHVEM